MLAADPFVNALRCMYSYARTCQRAQGGEWNLAICDLSNTQYLGRRRSRTGYTALTRARSSAWLQGWPAKAAVDKTAQFKELIQRATDELREVLGTVTRHDFDNGRHVSLRGVTDGRAVRLDVWPNLTARVVEAPIGFPSNEIERRLLWWADDQRAIEQEPPDACLEPMLDALTTEFDRHGVMFDAMSPHQYEVILRIEVSDRRAQIRSRHNQYGQLTKEMEQKREGDAHLLDMLLEAVKPYWVSTPFVRDRHREG